MSKPCKIGDTIRTVRKQSVGTFEGNHIYCDILTQDACDRANEFIADGRWELFEGEPEDE